MFSVDSEKRVPSSSQSPGLEQIRKTITENTRTMPVM